MKKAQDLTRILISMPEGFLQQVDKMAEEENRSRSELGREALRRYMRRNAMMSDTIKAQNNAERIAELLGDYIVDDRVGLYLVGFSIVGIFLHV